MFDEPIAEYTPNLMVSNPFGNERFSRQKELVGSLAPQAKDELTSSVETFGGVN